MLWILFPLNVKEMTQQNSLCVFKTLEGASVYGVSFRGGTTLNTCKVLIVTNAKYSKIHKKYF